MSDPSAASSSTVAICPWCSAALPVADAETCPSCGATLLGEDDRELPGVTAIDATVAASAGRPKRRASLGILGSLLGAGDDDIEVRALKDPPGSLQPPDPAVRREMLRLELEAQVSELEAEATSLRADAAVEAAAQSAGADTETPAAE
jgi:hypothetical protein